MKIIFNKSTRIDNYDNRQIRRLFCIHRFIKMHNAFRFCHIHLISLIHGDIAIFPHYFDNVFYYFQILQSTVLNCLLINIPAKSSYLLCIRVRILFSMILFRMFFAEHYYLWYIFHIFPTSGHCKYQNSYSCQ